MPGIHHDPEADASALAIPPTRRGHAHHRHHLLKLARFSQNPIGIGVTFHPRPAREPPSPRKRKFQFLVKNRPCLALLGSRGKTMNAPLDLAAERPGANKRMKTEAEGEAKVRSLGPWSTRTEILAERLTTGGNHHSLRLRLLHQPPRPVCVSLVQVRVSPAVGFLASRFPCQSFWVVGGGISDVRPHALPRVHFLVFCVCG